MAQEVDATEAVDVHTHLFSSRYGHQLMQYGIDAMLSLSKDTALVTRAYVGNVRKAHVTCITCVTYVTHAALRHTPGPPHLTLTPHAHALPTPLITP